MSEKPEAHTPRFLAWLYSTPSRQPALAALCAIEREIGASLRPGLDHHVAHTRLEWWREECGRCVAGHPVHPLTRELRTELENLTPAVEVNSLLAGLSGLVDTATWDVAAATFERRAELTAYCRRWAAAMITPASWSIGTRAENGWTEFGAALRELELLDRLVPDARSGRLRLPLDELEQAAVTPQIVAAPPWPPGMVALVRTRHRALRERLATAVASLSPRDQQSFRGLVVWGAVAWQASLRAERALPGAPAASIASAAAASWRAWRAARLATAGTLRLR